MFHAKDGWYFVRLADGSVKIVHDYTDGADEVVLTSDEWASVVATVSCRGENLITWNEAQHFHNKSESAKTVKNHFWDDEAVGGSWENEGGATR